VRVFRAVALVAGVAIVALLPLYGDVRPSAFISHAEWARLMLRGLDLLADAPGVNDTAAQAFATLSGRDSRSWPADQYVRGSRVEAFEQDGVHGIRAAGGIGEAIFGLGIARQGDYRLRLHLSGPAAAEAEMTKAGSDEILRSFTVPAGTVMGWVDAGSVHLDPGAYDATVLLPEGSVLEHVELAPPCLHPIEPRGGWKAAAPATTEDVAVTLLQALDLESELPPAAPPVEFHGSDLTLEDGSRALDVSAGSEGTFRGGPKGSRVVLLADIPDTGLYTLSVFGVSRGGERWMADGCRQTTVCPSTDSSPRWRVLLSGQFQKGPHLFSASLGPDTAVQRIRLEQKKDTPGDYVATLDRLGLDLTPAGPISREKAEEARRFLEHGRAEQARELCGDILRPGTLVAELATSGPGGSGGAGSGGGDGDGGGGGGGGQGGGGGGGGGGSGVPPPVVPSLPPPSPVLPDRFAGR